MKAERVVNRNYYTGYGRIVYRPKPESKKPKGKVTR